MFKHLLPDKPGSEPLAAALRACRWHFIASAGFSALVNLLYLAPTLYMMQVYDRVVPTGGMMTLALVTGVVLFALASLSALDAIRSRLLVRAGLRLDLLLSRAILMREISLPTERGTQGLREFDAVRSVISGQGAIAIFDLPWTPVYLLFCFLLHPALGAFALVGALMLFGLAVLNERDTRPRIQKAYQAANTAYAAQSAITSQSEVVRALGMGSNLVERQAHGRLGATVAQAEAQFVGGRYSGVIKFLRLAMQSLALGLGAYLATKGQISVGAIIATSVLLSRAVSPIETVVGAWPGLVQAHQSWRSLVELFGATAGQDIPRTELPPPVGLLALEGLSVRLPQTEVFQLKGVSLKVAPGQVLGVVGPSGAGKTTLARVMAGAQPATAGVIRLDGGDYEHWNGERLAGHIGYLPQTATLFAGSIKDNISRFAAPSTGSALDAEVIAAAMQAGVHDLVQRLPQGYDTVLGPHGAGVSAGQAQRIALARALFGQPSLLVLDEPNSHLDAEGELALAGAIDACAARGAAVVIVAHRAGILKRADLLLALKDGAVEMFGPRDEVVARMNPQRPVLRQAGAQ